MDVSSPLIFAHIQLMNVASSSQVVSK